MKNKWIYMVLLIFILGIVGGCTAGTGIQISTPVPDAKTGPSDAGGQIDVPGFKIQLNAPGPNPLTNTADLNGRVAGLVTGLWHGFISPVTLVVSFISKNVQMYEVHNDRSQYDLGFLIGVAIIFLVLGVSLGRRR